LLSQKKAPKSGIASSPTSPTSLSSPSTDSAATMSLQRSLISFDARAGAGSMTTNIVGPDSTSQLPGV